MPVTEEAHVGAVGSEVNRQHFLKILGANPVTWAARYDLEPFRFPCSDCGQLLTTTVPFAYQQLRGLIAPDCSCGNKFPPYCVVRDLRFGDLLA